MKRESRLLLQKACDSLVLSIELFNRPHDRGRVSGTLIQLDHAFEMLMKAAILQRGGKIRDRGSQETIGFDACVRRSLTDSKVSYLTEEQALALQAINRLRDACQHHLLDISEGQLYLHAQSGVTLFRDTLKEVFGRELIELLPARVLPISTNLPTDLAVLFESELTEVRKLLRPGRRRHVEALARLRPLAILDGAIRGEKGQPSDSELRRLAGQVANGTAWEKVFAGVAGVNVTPDGTGPALSLRLTKRAGIPIQLVPEGTPGASVVAVRRVDELGFYSLGTMQLADKVGLTMPKTVAVVDYIGLRDNPECYKEFKIGKSVHKRYSAKAIKEIQAALRKESAEDIWIKQKYPNRR